MRVARGRGVALKALGRRAEAEDALRRAAAGHARVFSELRWGAPHYRERMGLLATTHAHLGARLARAARARSPALSLIHI